MGDIQVDEHAQNALTTLAATVERRFDSRVLAGLWAAEQIRRAMDRLIDDLLYEARQSQGGPPRHRMYTWEQLGEVLGMSAQGARQRLLRRRTPVAPPVSDSA